MSERDKPQHDEDPLGRKARPATKTPQEDKPADKKVEKAERGPLSPVQHEDDGWGDTPVQMRG